MRTVRAVMFDFDGVITERGFRAALRALAARCDLDYPPLPTLAMQALTDSGCLVYRERETFLRDLDAALGGVLAGA